MTGISRSSALLAILAIATACGCGRGASDGAAYCEANGGVVETRVPFYGTNGPNPLRLAGTLDVCAFTAKDQSKIYVSLDTLHAVRPSLAALAYDGKPPMKDQGAPGANPASLYCSQLGGTDAFGGVNASGGGWVREGAPEDVIAMCVFPDMSTIDSWGLTYHSNGIVRGADLTGILRYRAPLTRP